MSLNPFSSNRYLSKRPFLVVETTQMPRQGVNTSQKGWQNDPTNMVTKERATIVDRVNNRHNGATVVIDLFNSSVVRNGTKIDAERLLEHYISKYNDTIVEAIGIWSRKPEVLNAMSGQIAEMMAAEEAETLRDDGVQNEG